MDSSGGAGAEPDPRQKLKDDYPDWCILSPGKDGLECAWWPKMPRNKDGPEGLLVLRDESVTGLRERMEVFLAVWNETHNRAAAEEAARALGT